MENCHKELSIHRPQDKANTLQNERLYDNFTYNEEDNHIYLVIDKEKYLPPYFKDDKGNMLVDVDLPFKKREMR